MGCNNNFWYYINMDVIINEWFKELEEIKEEDLEKPRSSTIKKKEKENKRIKKDNKNIK